MTRNGGATLFSGLPVGFAGGFVASPLRDASFDGQARLLAGALGAPRAETVRARQVHGRQVGIVEGPLSPGADFRVGEADALLTNVPERLVAVETADCLPVLLLDPVSGWIAAVHAGWRGTAARILEAVLDALEERGARVSSLHVSFGPAISRERYEVGPEVVEALGKAYADIPVANDALRPAAGDRTWLDVAAYNRALLLSRGVPPGRIHESGLCTASRPELPSWRRDGRRAGRILSGIVRLPAS